MLSTVYITQQRPRIKTKFPSPGGNPSLLLKNSVEKFHGAPGTRGAPRQSGGEFPPPAPLPPPLAGSGGGTGYARRVRLLRERRKGPRVVRENDCCFILGEAVGPKGVGRISFFPRLFLDSPTGTPYLVCVINSTTRYAIMKVG